MLLLFGFEWWARGSCYFSCEFPHSLTHSLFLFLPYASCNFVLFVNIFSYGYCCCCECDDDGIFVSNNFFFWWAHFSHYEMLLKWQKCVFAYLVTQSWTGIFFMELGMQVRVRKWNWYGGCVYVCVGTNFIITISVERVNCMRNVVLKPRNAAILLL